MNIKEDIENHEENKEKEMDDVLKIFYQLISKISEIQKEDLQGCIMTSAKLVYRGKRICRDYQVKIEHENKRGMSLLAWGTDDTGEIACSLNVKLMKQKNEPQKPEREKNREHWLEHKTERQEIWVSERQVEEYLKKTGDTNTIHRGKKAVVPGLYMVCLCMDKCRELFWELFQKYENMQMKFVSPVHVGERIEIHNIKHDIKHGKKDSMEYVIEYGKEHIVAAKLIFT